MSGFNLHHEINYLHERIDSLEKDISSHVWFIGPNRIYGPTRFETVKLNLLPWIGVDGNDTWRRKTLVIPFFWLGSMIIGLRWKHYPTTTDSLPDPTF